jgi:glycine/D-amino acid oxidase-like deaminating enzyme
MRHIAVIGAGFAGLGVIVSLCNNNPDLSITLFDPNEIGQNTSGISCGLMHAFVGQSASMSWQGPRCYEISKKRLMLIQEFIKEPLFEETGLFRAAVTPRQQKCFPKQAKKYPKHLIWKEPGSMDRYNISHGGLWIKEACAVFTKRYLNGLYQYASQFSFEHRKEKVTTLSQLDAFDQVIVAAGDGLMDLWTADIALEKIKGQQARVKGIKPLPFSVSGKGHISKSEQEGIYTVGATYERDDLSYLPNKPRMDTLLDQVKAFYPEISGSSLIKIDCGIRLSRKKGYLPLVRKVDDRTTVMGAFGSRGLLYHAYYADLVVESIQKPANLCIIDL